MGSVSEEGRWAFTLDSLVARLSWRLFSGSFIQGTIQDVCL